ncbi:MAG: hypothetical protein HY001_01555 [Candidatus Portnoybacteria bacterium]|nr:hypothetical protein [Candidatus Portnoybacteria bacterium]
MQILADIMRITTALIALYVFYATHKALGVIVFGTALFSFVFKLRKGLFLEESRKADYWELIGVALVLANSLIIAFVDYNNPHFAWLDIPMHLAGGVFAGLWARLALIKNGERFDLKNIIMLLGIVALVGVFWEFFEWIIDHTLGVWFSLPQVQASVDDTMGDLLFDLLGGIAVFFLKK